MFKKLETRTKAFWLVAGYMLIALLGAINSQFPTTVIFLPLYLIPISILSWFVGKWNGVTASVLSTIMWLSAEIYSGGPYPESYIYYWNTFMCLGSFLTVSILISNMRFEMERVHGLSYTDTLTGVANPRAFHEIAQKEIDRARLTGQPFTLGYIDLDNLRAINDQLGFTIGDQVLQAVASNIQSNLRRSDLVARLGGDEFGVLLSNAGHESSREVINRIHHHLKNLVEDRAWPLTFSIGVLVCAEPPKTVDEILKLANELVLFVKTNGKDGTCFSIYKP
jgi:diguanylate cyclase (GGDEF)-like protein